MRRPPTDPRPQAPPVPPGVGDDPPKPNEGGSVALLVLIFVFLLGMAIGGCLR